MIECPSCHTLNDEEALICQACGAPLLDEFLCLICGQSNPVGTVFCCNCGAYIRRFDSSLGTGLLGDDLDDWLAGGDPEASYLLRLLVSAEHDEIRLRLGQQADLGRPDPANDIFLEVDLTAYDGAANGVSRRHVRLFSRRHDKLFVQDLDSSNGTFLNGVRLLPHYPERLTRGDVLRLGKMELQVFWEKTTGQSEPISHKGLSPEPHHPKSRGVVSVATSWLDRILIIIERGFRRQ